MMGVRQVGPALAEVSPSPTTVGLSLVEDVVR